MRLVSTCTCQGSMADQTTVLPCPFSVFASQGWPILAILHHNGAIVMCQLCNTSSIIGAFLCSSCKSKHGLYSVYVVKIFLCTDLCQDYFCSNLIMLILCWLNSAGTLVLNELWVHYGLQFHGWFIIWQIMLQVSIKTVSLRDVPVK